MAFTVDTAFSMLRRSHAQRRLAHAYLITGAPGSGKTDLAARLCALVNDSTASDPANIFQHPNVHLAQPESKSRRIVTAQIRDLEHSLQMRSLDGGRKVGLVLHVDRLQPQASNAFLKTLEEPPGNSLLLLLTSQPEALLETILSRCLPIALQAPGRPPITPTQEKLLAALAGHARIAAPELPHIFRLVRQCTELFQETKAAIQETHEDELKREEILYRQTTDGAWLKSREDHYKGLTEARYLQARATLVETLLQWWADALRQQQGAPLDFPEYATSTLALAQRLATPDLLRRLEALENLRDHLGRNVQEQLALEVAFLEAFSA